jgi:type I restriction enzyme S subunit
MTPDLLIEHFDRISEAPDAVAQLRDFILDLAIMGRLLPQNASDQPTTGRLNVPTPSGLSTNGINPNVKVQLATLPSSWTWLKGKQIADFIDPQPSHRTPPVYKDGVPYIGYADITESGLIDFANARKVSPSVLEEHRQRYVLKEGDFVIGKIGTIGEPFLLPSRFYYTLSANLILVQPKSDLILPSFLMLFLDSPIARNALRMLQTDSTHAVFGIKKARELEIPVPPYPEQERIVAKVEELMALCDRLEAAQSEREVRRRSLVSAANYHIASRDDPDNFRARANFYFRHFGSLTARSEDIEHLRETILNLAVYGKLVPQVPTDEPVHELVKRLEAQTSRPEPYPIPSSWEWLRVGQIGDSRLGKMLDHGKNKGTPKRYLRNTNVRWFDFDLSDVYEMRFEDSELDEFSLRRGDILICEGGEPGRAAVWDERETHIYFQKALHRVRFSGDVNPHFLVSVLRQSANSGRLATSFTGVGIKHLTGKGLASFLVPVPPLAEQDRIVARVDALMKLCDELNARITRDAEDSRRLLEAVLSKALGISEISEGRGFGIDRKTSSLCTEEGDMHERTI